MLVPRPHGAVGLLPEVGSRHGNTRAGAADHLDHHALRYRPSPTGAAVGAGATSVRSTVTPPSAPSSAVATTTITRRTTAISVSHFIAFPFLTAFVVQSHLCRSQPGCGIARS